MQRVPETRSAYRTLLRKLADDWGTQRDLRASHILPLLDREERLAFEWDELVSLGHTLDSAQLNFLRGSERDEVKALEGVRRALARHRIRGVDKGALSRLARASRAVVERDNVSVGTLLVQQLIKAFTGNAGDMLAAFFGRAHQERVHGGDVQTLLRRARAYVSDKCRSKEIELRQTRSAIWELIS